MVCVLLDFDELVIFEVSVNKYFFNICFIKLLISELKLCGCECDVVFDLIFCNF